MEGVQFFDPKQEVSIAYKSLPHWAQAGTLSFITWRTNDSLPASAIKRLALDRCELLRGAGLNPDSNWKNQLANLPAAIRSRVQRDLFSAWDDRLDDGCGACVLARHDLSQIVAESLLHFDNDRYFLTDFVVMPNHVHILVAFRTEDALLTQCSSWKRFTARQIHAALGLSGEFWQVEQFDHLVRGPDDFSHFRQYIANNGRKANLPPTAYRHYTKP